MNLRILGLDPGLRATGWGVIDADGNQLRFVADGVVCSDQKRPLSDRLNDLFSGLNATITAYSPSECAIEDSFVSRHSGSTLKLGHARGIALLAPAARGLVVAEYKPNLVKKSVVGAGHAGKEQVKAMVRILLPGSAPTNTDSADALAVAICHAHHRATNRRVSTARTNVL